MQTATAALATAIEAPVRQPTYRLSADWDADGHGAAGTIDDLTARVASVTVDRTLKGDIPEQVRLVEGYAAATMTVELAGDPNRPEGENAAWWASRFNTASPLYGKERLARDVKFEFGMSGAEMLPQFTGLTSALNVSSADRSASLTCLDNSERLRSKISLPPVVADDRAQARPGLSGGWLTDYVLRRNSFYATPPPPANVRFLATMRGSAYPETGTSQQVLGPLGQAAEFTTATEMLQTTATAVEYYRFTPASPLNLNTGHAIGVELHQFTVTSAAGGLIHVCNPSLPDQGVAVWMDAARVLYAGVALLGGVAWNGGALTGPTLPAGTNYLTVHFAFTNSGCTVTWRVNATTTSGSIACGWVDDAYLLNSVRIAEAPIATPLTAPTRKTGTFGQVTVTNQPAPGPYNNAFVPTAIIDPSLNKMNAVLSTETRDSAGLLTEIAAAEQATFGFDEAGVPRWRNRHRWGTTEGQTLQRTLTTSTAITDLDYDDALESVRNVVTVEASPVVVSALSDVWRSAGGELIRPRTSTVIWVAFEHAVVALDTYIKLASSVFVPSGKSRIRLNTKADGTGTDWTGVGVSAVLSLITATSAKLTIGNASGTTLYLSSPDGAGGVVLAGRTVQADTTGIVKQTADDQASVADYGEQTLDVGANPWRQTVDSAKSLASQLLGELCQPRPVLTNIGIVGDPRLQLGDRVRIVDREGLAIDGEYRLSGINSRLEGGKFTQRITARQAPVTLRWGVGRWGVNSWGV